MLVQAIVKHLISSIGSGQMPQSLRTLGEYLTDEAHQDGEQVLSYLSDMLSILNRFSKERGFSELCSAFQPINPFERNLAGP